MRRVFNLSSPSLLYGLILTPFSKFYCWDLSNFYIHVHNIVWLLLTIVWEFDHLLIPSVLVTSWPSQTFPFHLNFLFWFLDLDRLRDGEESSSWAGSECKHPNRCKWRNWRWGATILFLRPLRWSLFKKILQIGKCNSVGFVLSGLYQVRVRSSLGYV